MTDYGDLGMERVDWSWSPSRDKRNVVHYSMTAPTPEEQHKKLVDAFADGLELFESRAVERRAKEAAALAATKGGTGDPEPTKSVAERLLGL